ncbi:MAG: hypothetical protein AAF081_13365 [Actinomycetota bacterium]
MILAEATVADWVLGFGTVVVSVGLSWFVSRRLALQASRDAREIAREVVESERERDTALADREDRRAAAADLAERASALRTAVQEMDPQHEIGTLTHLSEDVIGVWSATVFKMEPGLRTQVEHCTSLAHRAGLDQEASEMQNDLVIWDSVARESGEDFERYRKSPERERHEQAKVALDRTDDSRREYGNMLGRVVSAARALTRNPG